MLKLPTKPVENWEQVRDEWLRAVEQLVTNVEGWCKANDWPTRRIDKHITESPIGEYVAPALLIQVDLVKLLLEPVARFVPGAEGVVDLYRMPEYDDVATLYRHGGAWQVHYHFTGRDVPPEFRSRNLPLTADEPVPPLTAEEFTRVVKLLV